MGNVHMATKVDARVSQLKDGDCGSRREGRKEGRQTTE